MEISFNKVSDKYISIDKNIEVKTNNSKYNNNIFGNENINLEKNNKNQPFKNNDFLLNELHKKINNFRNDLRDNIGILNIYYYVDDKLNHLENSLQNKEYDKANDYIKILNQCVKGLALDRIYLPEGVFSTGRNNYKLASQLREITYYSENIIKS